MDSYLHIVSRELEIYDQLGILYKETYTALSDEDKISKKGRNVKALIDFYKSMSNTCVKHLLETEDESLLIFD